MMNVQSLFIGWNFIRWLRLIMCIAIAFQAIETKDVFVGIIAVLLIYQAITNVGCCGINNWTATTNNDKTQRQEPKYEELK